MQKDPFRKATPLRIWSASSMPAASLVLPRRQP
jgi:hypothetical protein